MRQREGSFVVEGATLTHEAAAAGRELLDLFVDSSRISATDRALVADLGVEVTEVGEGLIERIAASASPQPVLAVVRSWDTALGSLRLVGGRALVLVGVADPGNLGTLLRCAEASGIDAVLLAGDCVDPFNPKVVRASAGSLFRTPFAVEPRIDLAFDVLDGAGMRILGTDASRGNSYVSTQLTGGVAVVLGNETHGLGPDAEARVQDWVHIPIVGGAESLNVAMAGAVLCFEGLRQETLGSAEPNAGSLADP